MTKEIKTAIIILIGIISFIIGFNFLKSTPIFSTDKVFYSVFDHSHGLQAGTPVTVNGLNVGSVTKLEINPKTAKIVVTFTCKSDFPFSKNSKAEIFTSLLGSANLQIVPALDGAKEAQSGDYLPSSVNKGMLEVVNSQIDPTFQNLNKTLVSADSLITKLNNVLNEQAQKNIQQSFVALNQSLQNLNEISQRTQQLFNKGEVEQTLKNAKEITANISKISKDISETDLTKIISEVNVTLVKINSLLTKIEQGEGALGQLATDRKLYDNLRTASSEMGLLLEDLRRNPKRYFHFSVFGKGNQKYEKPSEVEPSIAEREIQQQK